MYLKKLAILSFSVLFLFTGCNDKKTEEKVVKKEIKKVDVNVHTIKKQTYPVWVNFSGKTEALKKVAITSRVNGELKELFFTAGQSVKKGDTLFKIDDRQYKAVLAQKMATLKKDESSQRLALANLRRYEPLVQKGLAPREKLDELKARLGEYNAVVKADKSAVKEAKLDVEYSVVKATIDGKIGKSLVDIGNIITSSDKLAEVVQTKDLYVNFNPSSSEVFILNRYKSEEFPKVKILPENVEDQNLSLNGKVDFIDNVTNETTGTVLMRAKVDNHNNSLFPGTFVNIKLFVTDKIPVIAVNPNNLAQNQLGSYVLAVDENNKIVKKQVVVEYSNKELAIIKSGLKDGDRVVVSAINRLQENQEVNALEVSNPINK